MKSASPVEVKIGFFEEKEGVKSLTRLMSFIKLCIGGAIIIFSVLYSVLGDIPYSLEIAAIGLTIMGIGTSEKLIQKHLEK